MKEGNKNTHFFFFHSYASMRQRQNLIKGLLDQEGQMDTNMTVKHVVCAGYGCWE